MSREREKTRGGRGRQWGEKQPQGGLRIDLRFTQDQEPSQPGGGGGTKGPWLPSCCSCPFLLRRSESQCNSQTGCVSLETHLWDHHFPHRFRVLLWIKRAKEPRNSFCLQCMSSLCYSLTVFLSAWSGKTPTSGTCCINQSRKHYPTNSI